MSPRAKNRSPLERILLALVVFVVVWIAAAGVLHIVLRDLGFPAASLTWLNPVGAVAGAWLGYRVLRG